MWHPLPYGIRPLGFTLNTLFYLVVITAPCITVRAARRTHCRHRGLCSGCGYDVKDLPICPECGAVRSIAN